MACCQAVAGRLSRICCVTSPWALIVSAHQIVIRLSRAQQCCGDFYNPSNVCPLRISFGEASLVMHSMAPVWRFFHLRTRLTFSFGRKRFHAILSMECIYLSSSRNYVWNQKVLIRFSVQVELFFIIFINHRCSGNLTVSQIRRHAQIWSRSQSHANSLVLFNIDTGVNVDLLSNWQTAL